MLSSCLLYLVSYLPCNYVFYGFYCLISLLQIEVNNNDKNTQEKLSQLSSFTVEYSRKTVGSHLGGTAAQM